MRHRDARARFLDSQDASNFHLRQVRGRLLYSQGASNFHHARAPFPNNRDASNSHLRGRLRGLPSSSRHLHQDLDSPDASNLRPPSVHRFLGIQGALEFRPLKPQRWNSVRDLSAHGVNFTKISRAHILLHHQKNESCTLVPESF